MKKIKMGTNEVTLVGFDAEIGDRIELIGAKAGSLDQTPVVRKNKYAILATFPSSNTSVCEMQVLELSKMAKQFPKFDYITFSMDLPFALSDYQNLHQTENIEMFSDYFSHSVAKQLGVLIKENHLMARSMFILDQDNRIVYKQVNDQIKQQVDFKALIDQIDLLN
ncbi:redoxin domain-containing protein [Mycoplasmopsis iners]|uniref:redoxin domain-containing protein n=1 Tax=Mycoplasmopsis iners TaxID=76630 RepID=UPI000496BC5D|nr:redoxin domain-containing protein [Mycoplasmopsis iners]